jgi:hypothetical protein
MNDESYVQLCQRLFGQTVCPSWLWTDDGAKERFHDFLDDLSRCRGRWDSLSIGRHPFETNHRDSDKLQSHSRIAGQSSSRVFRTAEAERPSIHRKVRRTHRTGGIFPMWAKSLLTYAVCDVVCFKLWSDWMGLSSTYGEAHVAVCNIELQGMLLRI